MVIIKTVMKIASIEEVISTLREGRMVILADDELRENEGDFIMIAELVTPEAISFMAEHARTIITLAMTHERCTRLELPLMAADGGNAQDTAFTVTIEAAHGVTTGSSARDRATTIRTAVAADAKPADLVRPGHVFPLRSVPGGVLNRAGHTEAACDLARLAGYEPAGLISEIQLPNGCMARMPDLERIATEHNLPLTTIASLISYRYRKESLVTKVHTAAIETIYGPFQVHYYQDSITGGSHVALTRVTATSGQPPLVRVMVSPNFTDYLGVTTLQSTWSLPAAMARFEDEQQAIMLALQVDAPRPLPINIKAHDERSSGESQLVRTYGIGAQILRDLDVTDMRLLSSPVRLPSMAGFGLNITEIIQA